MTPERWEIVKDLFVELADSDPDRRATVLNGLEEEVRAEVERLLANYQAAQGDTSTVATPIVCASRLVQEVFRTVRVFTPGQKLLNRFEVRTFLGAGGMGEVYEAYDLSLGELVALKTVRSDLAFDANIVQRFRWEVQRARRVPHPNVCRVYDLFTCTTEDGGEVSFLTMELLAGGTLFDRVNDHPMSSEERLALARQICAGLGAAHAADLIHRDLKSANILLANSEGPWPRAVITDFGLANLASGPDVSQHLPNQKQMVGTMPYLAPELLDGGTATQRSDIYALGVVLFRMTTGRYPFSSTKEAEAARAERLHPPLHDLHQPGITPRWAETIAACIHPDPEGRPASAAEVSRRLLPRSATLTIELSNLLTRRSMLLGSAAVVALSAGGAWEYFRHSRPRTASLVEIKPFASQDRDGSLGRAVAGLFRLTLGSSPLARVVRRDRPVGAKPVDVGRAQQAGATGAQKADLAVTGEINAYGAGYRVKAFVSRASDGKLIAAAEETTANARDLPHVIGGLAIALGLAPAGFAATAGAGNVPLDEIDTTDPQALDSLTAALDEYSHGNIQLALALLERATARDENFALAYVYRAIMLSSLRRDDLALVPAARAMALKSRLSARVRPHAEAVYFFMCGDYTNALMKYDEVARVYPTEVPLQRHVSQMYTILSRPSEALQHARNAVELGHDNPQGLMMLASAYADANQNDAAWDVLHRADRIAPGAPYVAAAKGYVSLLQSNIDAALQAYGEVSVKPDLEGFAQSFQMRALLLGGRLSEAEHRLQLGLSVRTLEKDRANEDMYRYWLGQLFILSENPRRAIEQAEMLAGRDPLPPSLFPLRSAAEIAHAAGDADICRKVLRKLRRVHADYPSRRSSGILWQCEALAAAAEGSAGNAGELLDQAEEYWKDISISWTVATVARQQHDWKKAQSHYDDIVARKATALRFECTQLWVLSNAMAGVCRHADGRFIEAIPLYDQFLSLWGKTGLPIVRQIAAAHSGTLPTFEGGVI